MRRLKAPRPATATTVNGPRAKTVFAGRHKPRDANKTFDPSTQPGFLSVYAGQTCLGHLLPRGRLGIEAYNRDDVSLGLFPNQKAAADAVAKAGGAT
jgi:hypothetical protein